MWDKVSLGSILALQAARPARAVPATRLAMSPAARLLVAIDPRLTVHAAREIERLVGRVGARIGTAVPGLGVSHVVTREMPAAIPLDAFGRRRDFQLAATLAASSGEAATIPVGIGLPVGRPDRHALADVSIASSGTFAALRTLLAPPSLSFVLTRGALTGSEKLLAARVAVELAAAPPGPGSGGPAEGRLAAFAEDLTQGVAGAEAHPAPLRQAARALLAWITAWQGLALGDEARLVEGRHLLEETATGDQDAGREVRLRAFGDLALVSLALGGTTDGSQRLSEALSAARAALALIDGSREPALEASLEALRGRIALALGTRHNDIRLLREAQGALVRAIDLGRGPWMAGACGLDGLDGALGEAERRLAAWQSVPKVGRR